MTSQASIAAALGIDPGLVTRYKARGMPTDSVEAAQAWKDANIRARVRMAPKPQPTRVPAELDRLQTLVQRAAHALDCGRFGVAEEAELRDALCAVPDSLAADIDIPFKLWDVLTEDVYRAITECSPRSKQAVPAVLSPREAARMGKFWLEVARGRFRTRTTDR